MRINNSLRESAHHRRYFHFFGSTFIKAFVNTFKPLNNAAKNLITLKGIFNLAVAVGEMFLSVYLWRKTNSIELVVFYYLAYFPFVVAGYSLAAFIFNLKARIYIQIGISLNILIFILLLITKDFNLQFLIFLGAISGISGGFYWIGVHTLEYLETRDSSRDMFYSMDSSVTYFVALTAPIITAILFFLHRNITGTVPLNNYYYIFLLSIVILLGSFIYGSRLADIKTDRLSLSDIRLVLKEKLWHVIGFREFLDGLKGGADTFLLGLLMFFIFNNEANMSAFNSLVALTSMGISLKMATLLKRGNRLVFGSLGSLLIILARITLIATFTIQGYFIYAVIMIFASLFFDLGMVSTFYDAMDHTHKNHSNCIGFIYFREIPLALGRMTASFLFLLFFKAGNEITLSKTLFIICGFIPFFYFLITQYFERKYGEKSVLTVIREFFVRLLEKIGLKVKTDRLF